MILMSRVFLITDIYFLSLYYFNTLTATRVFKEMSVRPRVQQRTKRSLLGAPIDILVMRVAHVVVSRMIFRFIYSQH